MLKQLSKNIWQRLVFFGGDLHSTPGFPYFSWNHKKHLVSYDEILEALPLIQYGDIGVHRDSGYFSNIAIPGFMKHAWIHTEDGVGSPKIVEALSEGVAKHSPVYPMHSDYTIILTPLNVTDEERKGACVKANKIIGQKYDVYFKFDIEEELKFYTGSKTDEAEEALHSSEKLLSEYDHGFSCTEVVSFAWWHKREELQLFRRISRGKKVIIADQFMNRSWKIKWMSSSITSDVAASLGLGEEGLSLVEDYLK